MYFWLLIVIPVIYVAIMKIWLHKSIDVVEGIILLVVSVGIGTGLHQIGKYSAMSSQEILNGRVTGKEREHGYYRESYDCNCRTVTVGYGENRRTRRECDTCYRDHYTATWNVFSTVGTITIDHIDVTSRFRRDSYPDPTEYKQAFKGEPAAVSNQYLNYVRAASHSLFNSDASLAETLLKKGLIPSYPNVHAHYDVDNVISVGVNVPDLDEWNNTAGKMLAHLGPAKQMNFIIVIVDYNSPNYIHALESAWKGANKNDAVVAIGVSEYPNIDWVRVFSWSKDEMFNVAARDGILDVGTLNKNGVLGALQEAALDHFDRRPMEEFEYLKDEIEPPVIVVVFAYILMLASCIGLGFLFHKIDLAGEIRQRLRRY